MKKLLFISLLAMILIPLAIPGSIQAAPISIPINNSSFEADNPPSGPPYSPPWFGDAATGPYTFAISGWTIAPDGSGGAWIPNAGSYFTSAIPNGTHVAFSNGGTISQVLSANLAAGTYTLNVSVGHRLDVWPDAFPAYSVQLWAGRNPLALAFANVPQGQWAPVTLVYNALAADPFLGQPLEIRLVSGGAQVDFDKVSLTYIPVPASALLLGSGLLGLGLLGWRRQRS